MSKRAIWLLAGILLTYFAFTSGFVYEAIGSNITNKLVVPYSFALSGERTGLVGIFTKDDIQCAKWLNSIGNPKLPIAGDRNVETLLWGFYDISLHRPLIAISNKPVTGHYYIFARAWNLEKQKIITLSAGEGLREAKDWISLDMAYCKEVFRSGESVIYEYQREP